MDPSEQSGVVARSTQQQGVLRRRKDRPPTHGRRERDTTDGSRQEVHSTRQSIPPEEAGSVRVEWIRVKGTNREQGNVRRSYSTRGPRNTPDGSKRETVKTAESGDMNNAGRTPPDRMVSTANRYISWSTAR